LLPAGETHPDRIGCLSLLDAVVRETLRVRPVFGIVTRRLKVPMRIAGYDLPAGAKVAPCIYLAHRRPATYPGPGDFRPERFAQKRPGPAEWLPFGGGFCRCLGAEFSLYEIKVVLVTLLSRAQFRLSPGLRVKAIRRLSSLIPSQGMPLIMTARTTPPGTVRPG
jgi:cytochrome P450